MISHKRMDTGENIRDFVYGFHDGMVTTLAVITALTAASLDNRLIILAGMANILADGASMSLGGYLSAKSQKEFYKKIDLHPKKIATITFISFSLAGFIPLIPYFIFNIDEALVMSIAISFISFFAVGSLRTIYTKNNWLLSGFEMLLIGVIAVSLAYAVGSYISTFY